MKIKNIGNKIVIVGKNSVLPNETSKDDVQRTPALETLEEHGFIQFIEEKAAEPKAPKAPEAPKAPKAPKAEEAKA